MLTWKCNGCDIETPADPPYAEGDLEPCVLCEDGTARVVDLPCPRCSYDHRPEESPCRTWQTGRPILPGVYAVRGAKEHERWAVKTGLAGSARTWLLGCVVVTTGPKGGKRPIRWLHPMRQRVSWVQHWEWLSLDEYSWGRMGKGAPND